MFKKTLKRIFSLGIALCMCTAYLPVSASENEIADNLQTITVGNRTLCVDSEDGNFVISDTVSGKEWSSIPQSLENADMKKSRKRQASSPLIVNIFDTEAKTLSITANTDSDGKASVSIKENTATVTYSFEEYGFSIPLMFTLTESGFEAKIITNDIKETNSKYQIVEIELLPYFNAGYFEEAGFMLLPDGSGATVNFNNGKGDSSSYSQPVYGRDTGIDLQYESTVTEKLPIGYFGIAHSDSFSIALITEGAADAVINSFGNQSNNLYNRVYPVFSVRKADMYINSGSWLDVPIYQSGVVKDTVFSVQYILEECVAPGYSDMANSLRKYMVNNKLINSVKTYNSLQVDIIGATVKKKSFLGIPVNRIQKLTDFEEAYEIACSLNKDVDNAILNYINWNSATAWGKQSASAKLSLLGGKRAYEKLKEKLAENNGELYLNVEPITVYKGKHLLSYFTDYAHSIFGEPLKQYAYKLNNYSKNSNVRTAYNVRTSLIEKQIGTWSEKVDSVSGDGIAFSGIDALYTDFRNSSASRSNTEEIIKNALASIESKQLIEYGYYYTLGSTDFISNVPASSNNFDLADESIPFYQMLLHGSIPYSLTPVNAYPEYNDAFLRAVETGSVLHFILCDAKSTEIANSEVSALIYADCDGWLPKITEMYNEYKVLFEKIKNSVIQKHYRIEKDVFATVYDNLVVTVVNYSDDTVILENGMTVEPEGFVFYEGR